MARAARITRVYPIHPSIAMNKANLIHATRNERGESKETVVRVGGGGENSPMRLGTKRKTFSE